MRTLTETETTAVAGGPRIVIDPGITPPPPPSDPNAAPADTTAN